MKPNSPSAQPPSRCERAHGWAGGALARGDPAAGKSVAERVDGDLLAALVRARQVDERLVDRKTAGTGRRRLRHGELVERYLTDLRRRADAGEVAAATADRYASALAHYLA